MKTEIIDKRIVEFRRNLAEVLFKLEDLAKDLQLEKERGVLRETVAKLNAPFLFVVVGEYNSGKSSFVNALLGENICKVAPTICTRTVQEITFGENESDEVLGKNLKRITRPIELLKSIAIVDTPGTNSIECDHQIITENYVPHADLVIFVLLVKVPLAKSAWDLLSFVKDEWKRKVIFVLQQADLEQEHLNVQKQSVEAYALQKGVRDPLVFATSAMWELNEKTDVSGFGAVRDYIRSKITGGTHLYEKIEGQIRTVSNTCETVKRSLEAAANQLRQDKELQQRIQSRLDCGKGRSSKEIDALVDRLVTKYESIANQFKRKFRDGLEISKVFKRLLPGTESTKNWFEGLQKEFQQTLSAKVEEIAAEQAELFIGDVKRLIKDLLNDLEKITKPQDSFDTADQMEKRRADVLNDVKGKLASLGHNIDELVVDVMKNADSLPRNLVEGGAVAAIGLVIMKWATIAFIDITGGVLTAIGLSFAGFVIFWKRGKIIEQFERGLDSGQDTLRTDLTDKLAVNLRVVYRDIERVFQGFFDEIKAREDELKPRLAALKEIEDGLNNLSRKIGQSLDRVTK